MQNKLLRVAQDTLPNNIVRISRMLSRLKGILYYRWVFASFGTKSYIFKPYLLANIQFVHIGNSSTIEKGVRLEMVLSSPTRKPELRIGDNVNIEQNVHITCHNRIIIGSNVTITAMCSITDTTHPFDDVGHAKVGVLVQDDDAVVEIGDGTWIGVGAVILPNVRIGKRCVIGANAVVTKSIPDFSVALGSPARVVRSIRQA